jgi:hypothetical protein
MMFKNDLIILILAGKKTTTSRDEKLCEVGETTNLMADRGYSKMSGKRIRITKVYQKALGALTDSEARKEEFEDLGSFMDYWKKNIGPWDSSRIVWVHEFRVTQ